MHKSTYIDTYLISQCRSTHLYSPCVSQCRLPILIYVFVNENWSHHASSQISSVTCQTLDFYRIFFSEAIKGMIKKIAHSYNRTFFGHALFMHERHCKPFNCERDKLINAANCQKSQLSVSISLILMESVMTFAPFKKN